VHSETHQPMFLDAAAMKDKIRKAAIKEEYDVAKFYHLVGLWPDIARHPHFEKMTLFVIAFNALWISIDTDFNTAEHLLQAGVIFQVAEHGFCVYFSFEWFVRYKSFKRKRNSLKDAWFVFDSILVFMMVAETWVMTCVMLLAGSSGGGDLGNASILRMARLLRLSRMARMARLFRAMPELLILIKGMVAAMRSVLFTLCLLAIITYVFGIAFVQVVGKEVTNPEDNETYFGTVGQAMHTLLLDGALMDGTGVLIKALADASWVYAVMMYSFILLAALTVMNMLIGVLCEVVSAVAATERETLTVSFVKDKLKQVMRDGGMDANGDGKISKAEFSQLLEYPEACRVLKEVGVDVINLVDNIDFIFPEDEDLEGRIIERELTFGHFLELVLMLRGTNNATVKDIVDLRKFIKTSHEKLNKEVRMHRLASFRTASKAQSVLHGTDGPAHPSACGGRHACYVNEEHRVPTSVPQLQSAAFSLRPVSCKPEESNVLDIRARLVDALVTVQSELARFMEELPLSTIESFDSDRHPVLLGLATCAPPPEAVLGPTWNPSGGGCIGHGRKPPLVLLNPLRVQWLPGELSDLQGQLMQLQHALLVGLGDLQRFRERATPRLQSYRWEHKRGLKDNSATQKAPATVVIGAVPVSGDVHGVHF